MPVEGAAQELGARADPLVPAPGLEADVPLIAVGQGAKEAFLNLDFY